MRANTRNQNLLLTFGITHAVEQESIGVEIHGSKDGISWPRKPLVPFRAEVLLRNLSVDLAPVRGAVSEGGLAVKRWSRGEERPFFRFYVFAQRAQARTAAAGAA